MHQLGVKFTSSSQWVKYNLLLSKNHLKAVKLNYWKFELECSKNFQVLHSTKVRCLHTSNVTNKVAEFITQQLLGRWRAGGGVTSYLRKILIEGGGVISHIELIQQVLFVNFYIYMTSRLQNPRKPLQGSFVDIWMYKSGGKTSALFQ